MACLDVPEHVSNEKQNEEEDVYLSDIHVEQPDEQESCMRIEISMPSIDNEKKIQESSRLVVDSDGDYERPEDDGRLSSKCVLRIQHDKETVLSRVGLQMWRASLFLSDYVLNNLDLIRDKTVVDLGTGLGLTSFVTAPYARLVFATDLCSIVKRARDNWSSNQDVLTGNIRFRHLNWYEHASFHRPKPISDDKENDDLDLTEQDLEDLKDMSVILAADVVYDDLITIEFMNMVYKLLTYNQSGDKRRERCCIVANEKRINFNTLKLSEGDTAYDYFMTCLDDLNGYEDTELGYRFKVEEIKPNTTTSSHNHQPFAELNKYVKSYARNKFLYIFKITSIPI